MNILMNPAVSFTYAGLFESRGPWIHPERVEETYEIIYVVEGEVCLEEDGKNLVAKAGEVLLLLPHVRHAGNRVSQNVRFYWVHFHLREGKLPFEKRHFQRTESAALFKELLHYNNLPVPPEYMVNAVLMHILSELCVQAQEKNDDTSQMAETVYEWLRIHASADMTVEKAAAHFGFSPDHLTRLLKRQFGMGAGKILNRFVMNEARKLLCNTDGYVKEIAAELGFISDKAFIAFFKYHEGCFPTEFRARFSKTHMNWR